MARKQKNDTPQQGLVQFSVFGLVIFSVSLVFAGGLLVAWVTRGGAVHRADAAATAPATRAGLLAPPQLVPPWGELVVREIEMERPEEYVAAEISNYQVPNWTFEGQTVEQVRNLMLRCGLTAVQVTTALSPELSSVTSSNVVIKPDDDLVYGLSPEVRSKLYAELAQFPANHFMQYPFCMPGKNFEDWFEESDVKDAVLARIRKLVYQRGPSECFSDFEVVMRGLASEPEKLSLVKALSRQTGLLVRLQIRTNSDVDKILGYWDRGIQAKDARPLLESVKRQPDGGTLSVLYLLPKFARERLYTFPLPPKPNDPAMDCHWTTMNFFNDRPDDRFSQPAYTVEYLRTNCYTVAKANQYGDIILVLDEKGNGVHSAVYLADDILFTKNGNNYTQPWMLMRLNELVANYSTGTQARMAVYRRKGW
jgi:hypothetical protein